MPGTKWTLTEFAEYSRKRGQPAPAAAPEPREAYVRSKILELCRKRGWIVFAGSAAHRTYRTLGEPDLIVLAPQGRGLFVELKSKRGKLRSEQAGMILWAAKLGHTIHVVRSVAEFERLTSHQPPCEPPPEWDAW